MDAGDEEDKEDQKDSIQEVLPDFGEVEGQRVQLKGLDYTLLAEQAQDHKQGFTEQMRLKLDSLTHRLIGTQHHTIADSNQYLNKDNDQLTRKILASSLQKPVLTLSTFYQFDTRYQFGRQSPSIFTKRLGKMRKEELYIEIPQKDIFYFQTLCQLDEQYEEARRKETAGFRKMAIESDSDDIFAEESEGQAEQTYAAELISIGRPLNFNVSDQEIFSNDYQAFKRTEAVSADAKHQVQDKYEFLRKKIKVGEDTEEGYGECYNGTGPSLDEMRDLKKQGIELFEIERQYKPKERKININKDYEKVKRIIEEKYGKK